MLKTKRSRQRMSKMKEKKSQKARREKEGMERCTGIIRKILYYSPQICWTVAHRIDQSSMLLFGKKMQIEGVDHSTSLLRARSKLLFAGVFQGRIKKLKQELGSIENSKFSADAKHRF